MDGLMRQSSVMVSAIKDPWDSNAERDQFEELANLYALFHECEALEKAKNRCRELSDEVYRHHTDKLISAFSRSRSVLSERGDGELDKFLLDYDIRNTCKYAVKLLLDGDVHAPPTTGGGAGGALSAAVVANVTDRLIYLLDLFEMDLTSIDEVLPNIKELMRGINALPTAHFPEDWIARKTCTTWHAKLTSMAASENMSEADVRQLKMELTDAKTDWHYRIESL